MVSCRNEASVIFLASVTSTDSIRKCLLSDYSPRSHRLARRTRSSSRVRLYLTSLLAAGWSGSWSRRLGVHQLLSLGAACQPAHLPRDARAHFPSLVRCAPAAVSGWHQPIFDKMASFIRGMIPSCLFLTFSFPPPRGPSRLFSCNSLCRAPARSLTSHLRFQDLGPPDHASLPSLRQPFLLRSGYQQCPRDSANPASRPEIRPRCC